MPASADSCDSSVQDIFYKAQFNTDAHQLLAKYLITKYRNDVETVNVEFYRCLKVILIQADKLPIVERSVEFVAAFCSSLNVDEDGLYQFLKEIFNFLLQYHDAKGQTVRYRVCQLIDRILHHMGSEAALEDDICDKIVECMLERIQDRTVTVRVEAVKALSRMQQPEEAGCPIIKAFIFHMERDPSAEVRSTVTSVIAISQVTLPYVIQRTLDVRETVRCTAYKALSRINMRSFSIGQRQHLLRQGLRDRSETVKNFVTSKLLDVWFASLEKNFIEFMSVLDVENTSETSNIVLDILIRRQPLSDVISGIPLDQETHLVPLEKLTPTVAFYWRNVATFLHPDNPDEMEKIVPELTRFCSYISRYVESTATADGFDTQKEFVLKQLLEMIPVFDLADERGRSNLKQLLLDLLPKKKVQVPLVHVIVPLLYDVIPDTSVRLQALVEIVSDIHEPLTIGPTQISSEEKRRKEVAEAELRFKIIENQCRQEEAINRQDFLEAEALKTTILGLEKQHSELAEQKEVLTQEVRQVENDPVTLTKCMTIVSEMMQFPDIRTVTPQLRSLLDNFVLDNLEVADISVLNARLVILGVYSLLEEDIAKKYIDLFIFYFNMNAEDSEEIRLTVTKALSDLFLVYGLEVFNVDTDIDVAAEKPSKKPIRNPDISYLDETVVSVTSQQSQQVLPNPDNSRASFLLQLCSTLNSVTGEIRRTIAETLCKLLLSGRISSVRTISHLLLLWFNPVSEEDPTLRQLLGYFLQMFTSKVRRAAEILENAFLPTLYVILDAPPENPLSDVDVNEVVSLLLNITKGGKDESQANVHNGLAVRLCNEVLKNPENIYNRIFLKTLVNLSLTLDEDILEALKTLTERMKKVLIEKICLKYVKKFEQILERKSVSTPNSVDAEANGDIEPNRLQSCSEGSDSGESLLAEKHHRSKNARILTFDDEENQQNICNVDQKHAQSVECSTKEDSKEGTDKQRKKEKVRKQPQTSARKLKTQKKVSNQSEKCKVTEMSAKPVQRKIHSVRNSTVNETPPSERPLSPNPEESIARNRPRRTVKISVLETFDDSTDESLSVLNSGQKRVIVSETSESEWDGSSSDDGSDDVFVKTAPKPKKISKMDKNVDRLGKRISKLKT